MKKILLGIIILFLSTFFGYCQERLLPKEELSFLRKEISDIEDRCTPKKGTPIEEVERIFGEGKPAPIGKMPAHTATPDSPVRSYEFCENGTLYVYYKDDKVLWSHYLDPYSVKGRAVKWRDDESSIKEQLQEAKPRLKQLEAIQVAYLKRIDELKQPLQLIIKSDKEVYKAGESISISYEAKNISDKLIKTRDYHKPGTFHIYLTNEYGQKHNPLNYILVLRGIIPLKLLPGKSVKLVEVTFIFPNTNSTLENYKVLGKHSIYAIEGNLTSNTIQIEVVEKRDMEVLSKEVLLNICNDIEKIKPKFSELSNFGSDNPIIFGNLVPPSPKQLEGLQLNYQFNAEYIQGINKRSSGFKVKEKGCYLRMQLFPDGGSWAGMRSGPNIRNVDVYYNETDVRIQAHIECPNEELAETLEKIIRNRIVDLQ